MLNDAITIKSITTASLLPLLHDHRVDVFEVSASHPTPNSPLCLWLAESNHTVILGWNSRQSLTLLQEVSML